MALLPPHQLLLWILVTLPFAVPLPVRNSTFSLQRGEPLGHDSPLPLLDGTAQSKSATRFPGGLSEQEKKLGPLLRPGEHVIGDLAGFSSPHPKAKAPRAEKKFREMPNGPYKKPNPVVRLWHQITGKKEEEPYLEWFFFPSPEYRKAWENIANEVDEKKKLNIFQRFWNWVKSLFPCLKERYEVKRIYGENGYWTNQKCKPKFDDTEYGYSN